MIITILLILVLILLIVSIYVNYNLYRKYSTLESTAIDNQEFILAIRNRVITQRTYLRQLDKLGAFESDDEVGFFFKELKKIIIDIESYFDFDHDALETLNSEDSIQIPTTPRNGILIERLKNNGNG